MPTALLMAAKKDERLRDFAAGLMRLEWSLLGSRGTAKFLNENDVPTQDIAVLVGAPILGHRVVSLSREIAAGLISKPEDSRELGLLRITRIDLIFVDFYHTDEVIAKHPNIVADYEAINEEIDIGGPTAIRCGIKGGRVTLTNPATFKVTLGWLEDPGWKEQRSVLASTWADAEKAVADYCRSVAEFRARYYMSLIGF